MHAPICSHHTSRAHIMDHRIRSRPALSCRPRSRRGVLSGRFVGFVCSILVDKWYCMLARDVTYLPRPCVSFTGDGGTQGLGQLSSGTPGTSSSKCGVKQLREVRCAVRMCRRGARSVGVGGVGSGVGCTGSPIRYGEPVCTPTQRWDGKEPGFIGSALGRDVLPMSLAINLNSLKEQLPNICCNFNRGIEQA